MSKMTIEEYEDYVYNDEEYACFSTHITNDNIAIAEKFIERIREYHREIGDVFVGHTCVCTEVGTMWKFVYAVPTFSEECDVIHGRRAEIFDTLFEEQINAGLVRPLHHGAYGGIDGTVPCICPFSMK